MDEWRIKKVTISMWDQIENGIRSIMLIHTEKINENTKEIKDFFRVNGGFLPNMPELCGDFQVWGGEESINKWLVKNGFVRNGYFLTENIE